MPEPDTDKYRLSPEMSVGLEKPAPYPRRAYVFTTDDEAYQFREPNKAYDNGSIDHELPDGLQSNGTYPRHWGAEIPADNQGFIRHNPDYPSEQEKANLSSLRGSVAHHIKDPVERRKFLEKQGELEAKGPTGLDRPMHDALYAEAQSIRNKAALEE